MNTIQNISLCQLVESFYNKENEYEKPLGVVLFDTLRKVLGENFTDKTDKELRKYILQKFDEYFKTTNALIPCSSQDRNSFSKNMRNWVSDCYKSKEGKYAKDVDRTGILTIAFVLGLDDKQCDLLLTAVNQHPLHRGDMSENILAYCYKSKKTFSFGIEMYDCFTNLANLDIENLTDSKLVTSFSQRSKFVKENMDLTRISRNDTEAINFSENLKQQILEWKNQNHTPTVFDDNDIQVINNLLLLKNSFSTISNKTMVDTYKSNEINNKKSRSFLKKIFSGEYLWINSVIKQNEAAKIFDSSNIEHLQILELHNQIFETAETRLGSLSCISIDLSYDKKDPLVLYINKLCELINVLPRKSKYQQFLRKYKMLISERNESVIMLQIHRVGEKVVLKCEIRKAVKSANAISNIFCDLENTLNNTHNAHPTRTYVILLGIVSWCQSNRRTCLSDYVDDLLNSCDFHLLDDRYSEDRFVMELNNYAFDGNIYYINPNDKNIQFQVNGKWHDKATAYNYIIVEYLSRKDNVFDGMSWIKSNQFFDFENFRYENGNVK